MTDYRVNLDIFAGPMDLLLYLVRKEEVDIYDIPIAKITDQYIQHLEMLKRLDIDLAADFLVMAATLMQIKSAMLLPKAEPDQVAADTLIDPRAELIRQLLEYKKFKDAANLLDSAADEAQLRYPRPPVIIQQLQPNAEPEIDLEQVSIWNLLEAFDAICKATGSAFHLNHIDDETPIDLYQIEVLSRLQSEGALRFEQIFEGKPNRLVMVGLFLALLELIRDGLVGIEQIAERVFLIKSLTDEPAEQAVHKAILASEQSFEVKDEVKTEAEAPAQEQTPQTQEPAVPTAEITAEPAEADKPIEILKTHLAQEPSIPIVEIPAKPAEADKPLEIIETLQVHTQVPQNEQPPIPIVELPVENKKQSADYEQITPAPDNQQQSEN